MGLFSFFKNNNYSKQGHSVFPEERFVIFEAQSHGKPIIETINGGYKNYPYKSNYPWRLRISIGLDLNNLLPNELPNQEESTIAYTVEDKLLAEMKELTTIHYIGHVFNDTFLDVYVYTNNPEIINDYLKKYTDSEVLKLERDFGYEMTEDPNWNDVSVFLNVGK